VKTNWIFLLLVCLVGIQTWIAYEQHQWRREKR